MLVEQVIWNARFGSPITSDGQDKPKDTKGEAGPTYGEEAIPPLSNSKQPLPPIAPFPAFPAPGFIVQSECSMLDLSINAVQQAASQSSIIVDTMDSSFHQAHGDEPSPYHQNCCPLCFKVTLEQLKKILKGLPNAEL